MSPPDHFASPQRLLPDAALPPYSYVSRHFPHPIRDPGGHMFGHRPEPVPVPIAEQWRESRDYLRALDLFNWGYYWEAHEQWEALWHAVGQQGLLADFFKGLIKLAAAGVKVREGRPAGVVRHARRARELFEMTSRWLEDEPGNTAGHRLMGLDLDELCQVADRVANNPPTLAERDAVPPLEVVFDFRLVPT